MRIGALSLVLTLATAAAEPRPPLPGVWRGPVRLADGTTVELLVTIVADSSGVLTATLDVPAQATFGLPVTELAVEGVEVAFSVAALPGAPHFTGRLAGDGSRLAGVMKAEETPAPATDIYLAQVGEDWTVGELENATARPGYDSQPAFLPDGSAFLYTSQRDRQTDIYRYDLAAATSLAATATPESEYSPTPMPGGTSFSTVRVEADGVQHLWRFPLAGGEPQLLLPDIAPVGYHAWLDETTVALFVLGEPATLRLARLGTPGAPILAEAIGRCLARVPGTSAFSYVNKTDAAAWQIVVHDPVGGETTVLGSTVAGSEDYAWTDRGELVMGQGSKLFLGSRGDAELVWREIADLAAAGVSGISRLALSPDGTRLAIVGETPAPPGGTVETPFELVRSEP